MKPDIERVRLEGEMLRVRVGAVRRRKIGNKTEKTD